MSLAGINGNGIDPETIKGLLQIFNGTIEMLNLQKESKIKEKSILDEKTEQINTKHRVLSEQIFYPLYQNIISIDKSETNFPIITFTASQVYDSMYYDDGLKHLQEEVDKFLPRLQDIEKKVKIYNEKLIKFNDDLIKRHVCNYIIKKGFEVTDNANNVTPSNTINLSNLLPELKSYWFGEKTGLPVIPDNKSLIIPVGMGRGEIATFSNDDEKLKVENLIKELKNLDEIKKKFIELSKDIKDIVEKSIELSKDIGKNIIKFIEYKEYDNKCKICNISRVP